MPLGKTTSLHGASANSQHHPQAAKSKLVGRLEHLEVANVEKLLPELQITKKAALPPIGAHVTPPATPAAAVAINEVQVAVAPEDFALRSERFQAVFLRQTFANDRIPTVRNFQIALAPLTAGKSMGPEALKATAKQIWSDVKDIFLIPHDARAQLAPANAALRYVHDLLRLDSIVSPREQAMFCNQSFHLLFGCKGVLETAKKQLDAFKLGAYPALDDTRAHESMAAAEVELQLLTSHLDTFCNAVAAHEKQYAK